MFAHRTAFLAFLLWGFKLNPTHFEDITVLVATTFLFSAFLLKDQVVPALSTALLDILL